jgi:hypothetical protein
VSRRPDGKPFDHIGKVREQAAGLRQDLKHIQKALGNSNLSAGIRSSMQSALARGSKLLDRAERVLDKIAKIKRESIAE